MDKTIGKVIIDLMNKKGCTIKELSEAIGATTKSINQYISEQRRPRDEIINKMSIYFNVPIDMFI